MPLNERVHIARRFLRSIRIDADLDRTSALEGFVCPASSARVLENMARHVAETGQGAFTWTGPYGSGKSSLAVALSALLSRDTALRKSAKNIFGPSLAKKIQTGLRATAKGRCIIPVVGRRDNPVTVIGEALQKEGVLAQRPRGGWTESKVIAYLTEAAVSDEHDGIVLFIDEMGKFLEAAAQNNADVYILQQLAEAASRSKGRFLIIGVLHQAFEEYAHRLSHEMRDEWAKIQGRFIDLVVNAAGEEQIDLIARAIKGDPSAEAAASLPAKKVAACVHRERTEEIAPLAHILSECWPLHPVTACLLGPISRRRFGQNQRSIFGFLNSSEPHGFQDFLKHASDNDLYNPNRLWDYLRVNLEPSILASPDGHRWALAAEALERCESLGAASLDIRLLKTIAVIDLFKERSGIIANIDLLASCFPETPRKKLRGAFSRLNEGSFIIFKKFLDAYAVFAGSDFDIEQATRAALDDIDGVDFQSLNALAGLHPLLAKRHYHETGVLRWFDVKMVPVCDLLEYATRFDPKSEATGQFLLAIPTRGESEQQTGNFCQQSACYDKDGDTIVGIAKESDVIVSLARELLALNRVRIYHPELAGDSVARREVSARYATVQALLEAELHRAFDHALWFRKDEEPKRYRHVALNHLASDLADHRFHESPCVHNELLNRQKPSASAVSAQNNLLRRMVLHEGEERLGIEGFPAEGGLFVSMLESTGLYTWENNTWRFVQPTEENGNSCNLAPMWEAALQYVKEHAGRTVAVSELIDLWRKPPYGVKKGLMPILAVAFLLSQQDKLAIYREGLFRARFDDVDVEYLAKKPSSIQARWMDMNDTARQLLSDMADIVRSLDCTNTLVHLKPLDVARGLVAIYDALPQWTKRTMRLSANAKSIRDIFKRAQDPNKLLFDDIPDTFGEKVTSADEEGLRRITKSMREGLEELVKAYPEMLHRLREIMLAELRVPNTSPSSMAELRARAKNIQQISGDFRLEAFVGRLSVFDGDDETFEGVASLAANKPPHTWVDPDLDRATMEIADLGRRFVRAETFAQVQGREQKRHMMTVVIGSGRQSEPFLKEFDIADTDRVSVDNMIRAIKNALKEVGTNRQGVILAALAEISMDMEEQAQPTQEKKKKAS